MSNESPRVLITGSTSGIGLATARRVLAEGASVVVTGRQETTVSDALQALAAGERAQGVVCDLHTPEGTDVLVQALAQSGDRLDAAVLSHGGGQVPEIFSGSDPAGFASLAERMFLTNARLVHGLLPMLRASGRGGRIVLVATEAGRFPTSGEVMIGALAAANLMFVRTLARELARDSIRANVVAVSLTHDTKTYDRVTTATEFSRKLFAKAEQRMPFQVDADHAASAITYLLAPEADRITGQVIGVSGGLAI